MSAIDNIREKLTRAYAHVDDFNATFKGQRGAIYAAHSVGVHFESRHKHRAVLVMGKGVELDVTGHSEDGLQSHQSRLVKPMKTETEILDLQWPTSQPPAAVTVDAVDQFPRFTDTGGLCDGEGVAPLLKRIITSVEATIVKFDPFFPF